VLESNLYETPELAIRQLPILSQFALLLQQKLKMIELPWEFMIIAHRGYSDKAQENSLSAFDAAISAGAKGIECDLLLTRDREVIVSHNEYLSIDGKNMTISEHSLQKLRDFCKSSGQKILALDELFEYIKQKQVQFFLEIKSPSPILTNTVIEKIKAENLWHKIHITGFSSTIGNLLSAQIQYPKLQAWQILSFPLISFLKLPQKSYGVLIGWLDGRRGSQMVFRTLFPPKRLAKLKRYFEKNGFQVIGGVINNKEGFELFKQSGITDIITDSVIEAVNCFRKSN
jgi:glycerophosphoryl diester phosphodiesterase